MSGFVQPDNVGPSRTGNPWRAIPIARPARTLLPAPARVSWTHRPVIIPYFLPVGKSGGHTDKSGGLALADVCAVYVQNAPLDVLALHRTDPTNQLGEKLRVTASDLDEPAVR